MKPVPVQPAFSTICHYLSLYPIMIGQGEVRRQGSGDVCRVTGAGLASVQVWVEIPVLRPEVVSSRQVLWCRYGRACYSPVAVFITEPVRMI
ncbi:MAG: hypothetical protein ACFFD4_26205 [Candidatus Odinarchaeota archaeon]